MSAQGAGEPAFRVPYLDRHVVVVHVRVDTGQTSPIVTDGSDPTRHSREPSGGRAFSTIRMPALSEIVDGAGSVAPGIRSSGSG